MSVNQLYAGFDRLGYPGDAAMQWLRDNTNLQWCGFYLAPAPQQSYTGWMPTLPFLRSIGWGITPIYVGRQVATDWDTLDGDHGNADAIDAADLAQEAGLEPGRVIYLDIEQGAPLNEWQGQYYRGWVNGLIEDGRYYPGVYCSYQIASDLRNGWDSRARFWVYHVTHGCDPDYPDTYDFFPNELEPPIEFPTTTAPISGQSLDPRDSFANARMLQWCQSIPLDGVPCTLVIDGEEYPSWDFDTSTLRDPSDQTLSF